MPNEIQQKELEVQAALIDARKNYEDAFTDKDSRTFYNIMVQLSQLTSMYRVNMPMDEKAQLFKVCSAIYEAESEGRF